MLFEKGLHFCLLPEQSPAGVGRRPFPAVRFSIARRRSATSLLCQIISLMAVVVVPRVSRDDEEAIHMAGVQ